MKTQTTQTSITVKTFVTLIAFLTLTTLSLAQSGGVVISTNPDTTADPSAILDVQSTSQGVLIPRMTLSQIQAIANPATGLLVFCTDDNNYYYFNGSQWISLYNHYNNDVIMDKFFTAKQIIDSMQIYETYSYDTTDQTIYFPGDDNKVSYSLMIKYQIFPPGYLSANDKIKIEVGFGRYLLDDINGGQDCDIDIGLTDSNKVLIALFTDENNLNNDNFSAMIRTAFYNNPLQFINKEINRVGNQVVLSSKVEYRIIGKDRIMLSSSDPNGIHYETENFLDPTKGLWLNIYRDGNIENYKLSYLSIKVTRLR